MGTDRLSVPIKNYYIFKGGGVSKERANSEEAGGFADLLALLHKLIYPNSGGISRVLFGLFVVNLLSIFFSLPPHGNQNIRILIVGALVPAAVKLHY